MGGDFRRCRVEGIFEHGCFARLSQWTVFNRQRTLFIREQSVFDYRRRSGRKNNRTLFGVYLQLRCLFRSIISERRPDGDKYVIKGGYVVGVSQTRTEEGVEEDTTYKTMYKYNYVFSDFGKTVVTTPAGAADAIAAEKSSDRKSVV